MNTYKRVIKCSKTRSSPSLYVYKSITKMCSISNYPANTCKLHGCITISCGEPLHPVSSV